MDGDKTIEETAPPQPDDDNEAIDPEDQETVMFGQRHLFQDVEIAGAARRQEVLKKKTPRRRARAQDDAEWSAGHGQDADTLEVSPEEAQTLKTAAEAAAQRAKLTGEDAEEAITDETKAPGEEGSQATSTQASTVPKREVARKSRGKARPGRESQPADGVTAAKSDGADDGEDQASTDAEDAPSERRVAERRPGERKRRLSGAEGSEHLSCNCRICGRKVGWPRARRFRGGRNSSHGFRCDTCGNVFCSTHVLRVSAFWESLLHHGRFRCLLCELGQSMKQQDERSD